MNSMAATPSTLANYSGQLCDIAVSGIELGPAPQPVVNRLLRTVNMFRTVTPPTSTLQCVENAGDSASVMYPCQSAHIMRKDWLDLLPLPIRKPEDFAVDEPLR